MREGDILILDSVSGKKVRVLISDGRPFIEGCGFKIDDLIAIKGNISSLNLSLESINYHDLNKKVAEILVDV